MTEQSFREPENAVEVASVRTSPGQAAAGLPYSNHRRVGYGLLWAGWTAILIVAGSSGVFGGQVTGGVVALAIGALAGLYDYRIWTWRARRLLIFIIV